MPTEPRSEHPSACPPGDAGVETRLIGLAERIRSLDGWRRSAAAFAAGAVSMLAMAPTHLAPVLLATLPALLWLAQSALRPHEDKPAWRQLAVVGWWFGFGYHLIGLYWVGFAFLVEADVFAWLLPFAVTLLPAGLALFHAAALAIAGRAGLLEGTPLQQSAGLALALTGSEWLRGHILTGFPWNLIGYALTGPLVLMQSAALIGVYGLTLLAVFMFTAPAALLAQPLTGRPLRPVRQVAAAALLVPVAAMLAWGGMRLASPSPGDVPGVRMRLVQPAVPQRDKWRPDKQREFFDLHLDLSAKGPDGRPDGLAGITHVVWGEASMPFMPLSSPEAMARIADLLPQRTTLLAGLLRFDVVDGERWAYNSLAAIDDEGRPATVYDKIHLVPFGEYLPFQRTLEALGLEQLSRMRGGFSVGEKPRRLLTVDGLPPIGVLICYEAVFPAAVVQGAARPGALINVTNDGWFGATAGPYQHFHQARLRAVEEGLGFIRVSNNGISAVIDPYGRVLARLPLNAQGVIDSPLPAAAGATPYARWNDAPAVLAWIGLLIWLNWRRRPQ